MNRKKEKSEVYKGVRGRIIYTKGPEEVVDLVDGALIFDDEGKILACEPFEHVREHYREVELERFEDRLIIPGLVDCHLHLPQLDQRGRFSATLLDWLKKYIFPAEKAFSDPKEIENVGRRFYKKLILNGTTTASIYSTVHEAATDRAFELAKVAGVRAIIGKVMMDQNAPPEMIEDTAASVEVSVRLCEKWHGEEGGRLRYAFTPRFAPTCSIDMWREVGKARESTGAYVQSHIAETEEENELVKRTFPSFPDYFSVFEETGVAGPRTILGHAIYLSDDEYRRMAASRTKIAHCPTSNFFLKSGAMPMARVEEAGVVYGLGTDVGAGTTMSLFTEMRHGDYAQDDMYVSPIKGLYLGTLGGARALSLEDEIGSFEVGKYADFCVLDIKMIDYYYELADMNTLDLLSLLMYRGDGRVINGAYVAGKKLDVDKLNA
jgi:guanine deaminase